MITQSKIAKAKKIVKRITKEFKDIEEDIKILVGVYYASLTQETLIDPVLKKNMYPIILTSVILPTESYSIGDVSIKKVDVLKGTG